MVWVVAAAAVADADIEVAVRTERDVAAVVIALRMRDERLACLATRKSNRDPSETSGLPAERIIRDTTMPPLVLREVDVEAAARAVVGGEGEAEQPALAAACRWAKWSQTVSKGASRSG